VAERTTDSGEQSLWSLLCIVITNDCVSRVMDVVCGESMWIVVFVHRVDVHEGPCWRARTGFVEGLEGV